VNTARSIDSGWDIDTFDFGYTADVYLDGELKAYLRPNSRQFLCSSEVNLIKEFFTYYGCGVYRIQSDCTITAISINCLGEILANCWRCGNTIYGYQVGYTYFYDCLTKGLKIEMPDAKWIHYLPNLVTYGGMDGNYVLRERLNFQQEFNELCKMVNLDMEPLYEND
jgi:hypothetical protein